MTDTPEDEKHGPLYGIIADVRLAVAFLTRLPVGTLSARPLGSAAWAFPLAGLAVGAVGGAVLYAAAWAQLHPLACAFLGIMAMVLASGALHEDGLADVADGFGGAADRDRKLEIMRDSRIGSYGVLALIFSIGLRAALVSGLHGAGTAALALMAAAIGARAVMPMVMVALPPVRADGLGFAAGAVDKRQAQIAAVLGLAAVVVIGGQVLGANAAIGGLIGGALGALAVVLIAKRQIGGQTGDVLGAVAQVAEIGILIGFAGTRWVHA